MENVGNSYWNQRNVFVTGATGLLGSSLIEELVEHGANVICLVRDWVPDSRLIQSQVIARTNIVRGELEDLNTLIRVVNEYEVDTVFHLGAQTIVGTASRSPLSTFESNVRGTWNLLEACRICPRLIRSIVVASSDKAYGAHEHLPYTEDVPLQGRFPYDVSKSCADLISLSYHATYGLPIAITRCGNLYGGGDINFNRLIPGTIRSVLQGERPIIRSDGTFVRDYFYVRDAVSAYMQLAERLAGDPGLAGQAFNFGTETPLSVLQLVALLLELMGRTDLEPVVLNEANHEIPNQYLDCSKARRLMGWEPGFTMQEGLLETIAWYRERLSPRDIPGAAAELVHAG